MVYKQILAEKFSVRTATNVLIQKYVCYGSVIRFYCLTSLLPVRIKDIYYYLRSYLYSEWANRLNNLVRSDSNNACWQ